MYIAFVMQFAERYVMFRFVGINASDINHSAGRYDPGRKPPIDCGFEVYTNYGII